MSDWYDENTQLFIDRTLELDMSCTWEPFKNLLPKGGHILDVGCGPGRDTKHFLDAGYQVTAFDNSENMANYASSYTGIPVQHGSVENLTFSGPFDGIWCQASLLHTPKSQLTPIFFKLLDLLKVNGAWYLSFKHGEGNVMREAEGRFFQDFTIPSFQAFIQPFANIEIVDIHVRKPSRKGATVDWLSILLKKLA